jgi:CubicO group peptidase (beta-lactamase class C family)
MMKTNCRLALCAILLCGFVTALVAQAPARYPLPPESFEYAAQINRAREVVADLIKKKQIPGFSIAIACRGKIVWSEGFGVADLEQGVLVTPLTRFRLGSVSKLLTAAGLARLVEEGKLELDAPIQRYVPSFPMKPWPITTRQLAGHMSGIRHYQRGDFSGLLAGAPHFESVTNGLTIFRDDPLMFEPGTSYAYSSYGWNLISAAIEGASKEEFLSYMRRTVFEPLGLRSITADHVDAIIPHRSGFYVRNSEGVLVHAPHLDNSFRWASGGFLSNAEDLARFATAHLEPGFLRQSTLDLLFTSQKLKSGMETGVGIAWRTGTDPKGRHILHHGGAIEGGRAMLMMFPESKVVVVMLSNVLTDFGEQEAQEIGDLFIR